MSDTATPDARVLRAAQRALGPDAEHVTIEAFGAGIIRIVSTNPDALPPERLSQLIRESWALTWMQTHIDHARTSYIVTVDTVPPPGIVIEQLRADWATLRQQLTAAKDAAWAVAKREDGDARWNRFTGAAEGLSDAVLYMDKLTDAREDQS